MRGLGLVAASLVAGLRVAALAPAEQCAPAVLAGVGEGLRLAACQPRLRLMLALLTADAVVVGALDLLVVILAISVLGRSQAWAGYLMFAFGVGAVLAATGSAVLVGRRLGGPILGAALMFSGALASLTSGAGGGRDRGPACAGRGEPFPAGGRHPHPVAALGSGAADRPGLRDPGGAHDGRIRPGRAARARAGAPGGSRLALLGVAAVLPLAAVTGGRAVFRLDAGTPVPIVEIALLRSLPLFAELPAPAIEGLAAALTPMRLRTGAVLIRQGDPGDAYYAIAEGELDALQDGQLLRRCGRGEGVGEIALLRAIPRTATVIATLPQPCTSSTGNLS